MMLSFDERELYAAATAVGDVRVFLPTWITLHGYSTPSSLKVIVGKREIKYELNQLCGQSIIQHLKNCFRFMFRVLSLTKA